MPALRRRAVGPVAAVAAVLVLFAGCSSGADEPDPASSSEASNAAPTSEPTEQPAEEPAEEPVEEPSEKPTGQPSEEPEPAHPISMAALARADLTGGDLRLGAVRERTPAYTSYDVTYASTTMGRGTEPQRISGVLNVPTGRGPFPAVVLAHGYIDPAHRRGRVGDVVRRVGGGPLTHRP